MSTSNDKFIDCNFSDLYNLWFVLLNTCAYKTVDY